MTDNKTPFPSDKADKFMLRFPDGMREWIAEVAKANNRSMNAQIIFMLEEYAHMKKMARYREAEDQWEKEILDTPDEDLSTNELVRKQFAEGTTLLMLELLTKHGILPPENPRHSEEVAQMAFIRNFATESTPQASRTPRIPGQNAPKEGLGAAPKAEKPKKEKPVITKRKVFEKEARAEPMKFDHTTKPDRGDK